MEIITRCSLQPRGGGELLEMFDTPEEPTVEAETLLASYIGRFGEPFEVAYTNSPNIEGPVSIGWVFDIPPNFEMPGPLEQFEMVLIPLVADPDTRARSSLFLSLAEQKRNFKASLIRDC